MRVGTLVAVVAAIAVPAQASAAPRTAPGAAPVTVRVYLAPRGGAAALKRAVLAVSTPGRPRYRHFLTPRRFRARYEPSATRAKAVERSLRRAGMTIVSVERYRRWITARGPAQGARRAFGRTSAASARPAVLAVSGLDRRRPAVRPEATLPTPDVTQWNPFRALEPCSRYFGARSAGFEADGTTPLPRFRGRVLGYGPCGYTPRQLRSAYEGKTKLTGKGVTVAIVLPFASGTMRQDASTFARRHGDAPFRAKQYTESLPRSFNLAGPASCGDPEGWETEEAIDVEAVHGMAPGADVRYYAAASCDDPIDPGTIAALDRVDDENRASIVTNSYGDALASFPASVRAGYEQAILQAAMQGISVLWSSGDYGAVPEYPGSDPWVISVGGTSAAINARGRLAFQTGWASDQYSLSADGRSWVRQGPVGGASGGGFYKQFPRPAWQRGVVPATSPAGRAVPDIAMPGNAATGMRVGASERSGGVVRYGEFRFGGTSLASPLMAGVQALAAQAAHGRLGFADPAIYRQARAHAKTLDDVLPAHSDVAVVRPVYRDLVHASGGITYVLRTFGDSSGFVTKLATARGWDPVTGVGTPNARYLARQGR